MADPEKIATAEDAVLTEIANEATRASSSQLRDLAAAIALIRDGIEADNGTSSSDAPNASVRAARRRNQHP